MLVAASLIGMAGIDAVGRFGAAWRMLLFGGASAAITPFGLLPVGLEPVG